MNTRHRNDKGGLTFAEAIETLSNIVDSDIVDSEFDRESDIVQKQDAVRQDMPLMDRKVHRLHHKDVDLTVKRVRETFRVVLNYLQNFYSKEPQHDAVNKEQAMDGIKRIMVLVGEAAKKLDRHIKTVRHSYAGRIVELKEYKKLQEFYLSRIARKIDEGMLGKWIVGLSNKMQPAQIVDSPASKTHTKHVFVDLDSVKKDTEYELFFLRKDDGSRFFSPRLIRNVQLVSDFGGYFGEVKIEEPLTSIAVWQDRFAHHCAKDIASALRPHIDRFYREAMSHKNNEFVELLNDALMALMLCCNPHNLMHHLPIKSCRDYFADFQGFLREALSLVEYRKLLAYPPKKSSKLALCLLNTAHHLCMALYTQLTALQSLNSFVHALIQQAGEARSSEHLQGQKKSYELWNGLAKDYAAMSALLKKHANGPINKILDALEEGQIREFDPWMQGNLPCRLFTLYAREHKINFARWPSPTRQEFVNKVSVIDEFKGFLRACVHERSINKCLVLNFQDRTSWKEHFRCLALEDLPNYETFTRHVDVVTLAKDSEFYHQLAPYNDENHADKFKKHFKAQLMDENYGNVFPKAMCRELFHNFIDGVMDGIHRVFFSNKNILLREHRLDFIELFYLFLQLKVVELSKADIVGYTCKDGVDISEAAAAQLFVFLKLLNQERLSENDQEQLDLMIYAPSLFHRERLMVPERFNRLLSVIKTIETVRSQVKDVSFAKLIAETFGSFFNVPWLQGKVVVQRSKDVL